MASALGAQNSYMTNYFELARFVTGYNHWCLLLHDKQYHVILHILNIIILLLVFILNSLQYMHEQANSFKN